jgi:hypothetical protein
MTVVLPSALSAGAATVTASDASGRTIQTGLRVLGPLNYVPHLALSKPVTGPGNGETVSGSNLPPEVAVTVTVSFPLADGGLKRVVIHTFSQPSGALASVKMTVPTAALPGTFKVLALAPGVQGQVSLTVQGTVTATPTATPTARPTGTPTATGVASPTVLATPTATP